MREGKSLLPPRGSGGRRAFPGTLSCGFTGHVSGLPWAVLHIAHCTAARQRGICVVDFIDLLVVLFV